MGAPPPNGLCAFTLSTFASARCYSLTPGILVLAGGDDIRLVHGADTPANVFLWCILRGLAKHGTSIITPEPRDGPSHMFEIWTYYTEEADRGDRHVGDVGFTVAFIPNGDHQFYLHVYGYTNPVVGGWSLVGALYPPPTLPEAPSNP